MDWVAMALTVLSIELVVRKRWYGFAVGMAAGAIWVAYWLPQSQWAAVAINVIFFWQNLRGVLRWKRRD